jgi:hypothetical protein
MYYEITAKNLTELLAFLISSPKVAGLIPDGDTDDFR